LDRKKTEKVVKTTTVRLLSRKAPLQH